MADYPGSLDLIPVAAAGKEEIANALFAAFSPALAFGRRESTSSGLVWGYYGGVISLAIDSPPVDMPTTIPNGAITLTDDAICYIRMSATDGAIDHVSVEPTNWPASNGVYSALYTVTTSGGFATAWLDHRSGQGVPGPAGVDGSTALLASPNSWDDTQTFHTVIADAYRTTSAFHVVETGTSRTLSAADNGRAIHFTNGSAITLSMAGSLGPFSCTVLQEGAGAITFAANSQTMTVAGGLTKTAYAGAMATILSRASGTFWISGTLA